MNGFLWNIMLAVVWTMVTGNFAPDNFLLGFALGLLILFFVGPIFGSTTYVARLVAAIRLAAYFLLDLIRSNFRMAYDVIRPQLTMRPGVIAVPIDASSDAEIVLLANMVTLTPGSLSLDVSDDRNTLYLHVMEIGDVVSMQEKVKGGFERRILAVTR